MSGGSGGCGWTRTTRESTSLVHGQRAHFSMQRGLVGHPRTESRHRPQSQSREQQSESERAPSAFVVRSVRVAHRSPEVPWTPSVGFGQTGRRKIQNPKSKIAKIDRRGGPLTSSKLISCLLGLL